MSSPAVILRQDNVLQPTSEASALVAMIERAARDPSVDIDKMERLLAMHDRALARNAKAAFSAALAQMQPKLPVIKERGEIKIGGHNSKAQRYALWEDINEAIRPVLAEHGFALSFRTGAEGDKIIVTGILSHRDGHSEETTMRLPIDTSGSKNSVQAVGSSTSYGKRYTAAALLNLTSRGEDDDGKAAGAGPTITDQQVTALIDLLEARGAPRDKFLKWAKVERFEEIPAAVYDSCIEAISQFGAKR